jgi:hypothetical protein
VGIYCIRKALPFGGIGKLTTPVATTLLTPTYINVRVNGNNLKSEKTRKIAIRHRIN